ncbi:MAG: hypothetical protein VX724_02675 [Chloroflexota bacterium]|nr:hypothetical protein [Chloroflexota bacterium]
MEIKPLYKTAPVIPNTKSSASNILIALLGTALLVFSFVSIVVLVKRNSNEPTAFVATEATVATTSAGIATNPDAEILVLSTSINLLLDRIDSLENQLSERPQATVIDPQPNHLLLDRIDSLENQLLEQSRLNVSTLQPRMDVLTPPMGEMPKNEGVKPPPQAKKGQAPREDGQPKNEGVKPPPQAKKGQAPREDGQPKNEGVKPPPQAKKGQAPREEGQPKNEGVKPPPQAKKGQAPREGGQPRSEGAKPPPQAKKGPPPGQKKRSTQGKPPREKKGQRGRR